VTTGERHLASAADSVQLLLQPKLDRVIHRLSVQFDVNNKSESKYILYGSVSLMSNRILLIGLDKDPIFYISFSLCLHCKSPPPPHQRNYDVFCGGG
jgi:hypothetical protein